MRISIRREGDPKALEKLAKRMAKADGTQVRVGVFGSETHGGAGSPITMVELAAIHEFGSDVAGIPERSFIRSTIRDKEAEIAKLLKVAAKGVVSGKVSLVRALNLIGQWAVKEIKSKIVDGAGIPPPLAQATIKHKGSSRPLVDTGQLKNAITHVVVEDGRESESAGESLE